jgi:5-(aminomethyl)-3-furanmethanol phosphate kinase
MTRRSPPLSVIKIGGGVSGEPGALDAIGRAVAAAARRRRLLIVPGGGPFADAVRSFAVREPISDDAAHWMAILAMDQYAHVLAERIPGAVLVEEVGAIGAALGAVGVAVLAPSRWLRAADVLPHRWSVTSDSIAAFIAGALDADRLVLIKPSAAAGTPADAQVDAHFASVLPAGLPWCVLRADRMVELEDALGTE